MTDRSLEAQKYPPQDLPEVDEDSYISALLPEMIVFIHKQQQNLGSTAIAHMIHQPVCIRAQEKQPSELNSHSQILQLETVFLSNQSFT